MEKIHVTFGRYEIMNQTKFVSNLDEDTLRPIIEEFASLADGSFMANQALVWLDMGLPNNLVAVYDLHSKTFWKK